MIEYRDVVGFPGYRVGSDGSVQSCFRGPLMTNEWKTLKPQIHRKGRKYLALHLHINGATKSRLVHRIVLEAFVGLRPAGHEARHLDGNPQNNAIANLAWGTNAENASDTRRLGRYVTKLTEEQVRSIKRRRDNGESPKEIALSMGVPRTTVSSVINGHSWRHIAA